MVFSSETLVENEILPILRQKYKAFFNPARTKKVGIELEFPIITKDGKKPDCQVLKNILNEFLPEIGYISNEKDDQGNCIKGFHPITKDEISYEFTYGMMEFSLAPEMDIHAVWKKTQDLLKNLQEYLQKRSLVLQDIGINLFPWAHQLPIVQKDYYQMLSFFLGFFKPKREYSLSNFSAMISSSQVHLDLSFEEIPMCLNVLNYLGWLKSLLFANSPNLNQSYGRKTCFCLRDLLWEDSAMGSLIENVGIHNFFFTSSEEALLNVLENMIFYVKRDEQFICFHPLNVKEFFNMKNIQGKRYEKSVEYLVPCEFSPQKEDLIFSRPYNDAVITPRGTIEVRSECQQPFEDLMAPAAFHLGLITNLEKINHFLQTYPLLSFTPAQLRRMAIFSGYDIQKKIPYDIKKFGYHLLLLVQEGLSKRGFQEEVFLSCLFDRLKNETNPANELIKREKL